jgi:hypothetical protein
MSDQGSGWIEYTMSDGRAGRLAMQQVEMITKRPDGHHGAIHTVSGEVIPVVDVAAVVSRWRALVTSSR